MRLFEQLTFVMPPVPPTTVNGQPGSSFGNRFLFTGRESSELGSREIDGQAERPRERARASQWLSDLKLYDYRNRMYQPELGRFLQPDPKEFGAGDYNLYRYCHNDPVNRNDPFGLDFFPYNGPVTEVDQLYGGAGMGQTRVVTPVVPVLQADGTYTLRLDVRITGILVAERMKFHGEMVVRSAEQKRVTGEEHERTEHGKDWHRFHDEKQREVPTTRYNDPNAAGKAAKVLQNKFEGEARKARDEFDKHQPDERWKNIRDRELPH